MEYLIGVFHNEYSMKHLLQERLHTPNIEITCRYLQIVKDGICSVLSTWPGRIYFEQKCVHLQCRMNIYVHILHAVAYTSQKNLNRQIHWLVVMHALACTYTQTYNSIIGLIYTSEYGVYSTCKSLTGAEAGGGVGRPCAVVLSLLPPPTILEESPVSRPRLFVIMGPPGGMC